MKIDINLFKKQKASKDKNVFILDTDESLVKPNKNYYLFNVNLSDKAKCLLALMQYYSENNYNFSLTNVKKYLKCKQGTILPELEKKKYLIKVRKQTPKGYKYFYFITLNNMNYKDLSKMKDKIIYAYC